MRAPLNPQDRGIAARVTGGKSIATTRSLGEAAEAPIISASGLAVNFVDHRANTARGKPCQGSFCARGAKKRCGYHSPSAAWGATRAQLGRRRARRAHHFFGAAAAAVEKNQHRPGGGERRAIAQHRLAFVNSHAAVD